MAKKRRHGKRKFTLPIAAAGGVAAGVVSAVAEVDGNIMTPIFAQKVIARYTGVNMTNGSFNAEYLKLGLLPAVAGCLIHWGASKFGINRMIARAGVPILRI